MVGDLTSRSLIRELKRSFVKTGRIKTKAINAPSFVEGIDFSDRQNYLKFGFSAVMVTEPAYFRNANYHRMSDTYDTLDYDKMSAVVDSVYFALKDVIGEPPP